MERVLHLVAVHYINLEVNSSTVDDQVNDTLNEVLGCERAVIHQDDFAIHLYNPAEVTQLGLTLSQVQDIFNYVEEFDYRDFTVPELNLQVKVTVLDREALDENYSEDEEA